MAGLLEQRSHQAPTVRTAPRAMDQDVRSHNPAAYTARDADNGCWRKGRAVRRVLRRGHPVSARAAGRAEPGLVQSPPGRLRATVSSATGAADVRAPGAS